MSDFTPVKILWTGGWDSTFRLCELVLIHKRTVQPYYLLDPERPSIHKEVEAHQKIYQWLMSQFPESISLLKPVLYYQVPQKNSKSILTGDYEKMIRKVPFGSQYKWLAEFCEQNNINGIEISVEKSEGHTRYEYFRENLIEITQDGLRTYIFNPKSLERATYAIFKYFTMPLFDKTKDDMLRLAIEYGYSNVLYLTWFCHTPHNNQPCGVCNPCKDIIKYKIKDRVPNSALVRYYLRFFRLSNIKKLLLHG